jgi:hypothetical protein
MKNTCPHYFANTAKIFLALGLAAVCMLTLPGSLKAQSIISGDIAGTVTDPSGAAVPGSTVTVTSKATGAAQTVTTNGAGSYRMSLLKPGDYTLVVKATGFERASETVTVTLGTVTQADIKLTVGSAAQTVEVTGAAPILHTESADLSTTFSLEQVQSLPNPGQDLTFIAQTAPGAVMNTQGGNGNFSTYGLPATSNTFTVNGGYENDPFLNLNNSGATNLLLGNNDISDVSVISNAYDASYGGLGGSQINETTRSGANKFHGNASYFWNGRVLNANDFFNNQTVSPRSFDNVNQWAGAIGGPIKRDKSFFFFNYEGLRVVLPTRATVYAPDASYEAKTLANLASNGNAGEISAYQKLFALYDNATGRANATQVTPDNGTNPDGTPANGYGTVKFNGTAGNFTHEYLINGRIDQQLGVNDHLFGHFEMDKGLQATFTSLLNPLFDADSPQPQYQGQLSETHTFSSSLTNQFLFTNTYYRAIFDNTNEAAAEQIAPFTLIFADQDLANNGFAGLPGGEDYVFPQGRNVEGYQFSDDLNWNHGRHNIKIGWTIRRDNVSDYSPSELTGSPEAVAFNSSFQQGQVDEFVEQFPTHYDQSVALYAMGWYVQDQWKPRPNLTITAGLRMEHDSNPTCKNNCYARLASDFYGTSASPTTPYNQLITSGQHVAFNSLQKIGWEPRIGIAYLPFGPDSKTTVRGGFGIFADSFPGQIADSFLNNAPTNVGFTLRSPNAGGSGNNTYALFPGIAPNASATQGSAHDVAAASNVAFSSGFAHGATLTSLSAVPGFGAPNLATPQRHISYPTYEEWSLTVEHQLTRTASLSVGYVGNHTYRQPIQDESVNASGFGSYTGGGNPNFAQVTEVYSEGSSNYNGLITSLVNRARWLTLQLNYSYSHALDDDSNGGFNAFGPIIGSVLPTNPNISLLNQNYGNADYDTRHYVSGSYVITIPHWGGPKALTDGWEISGTTFHNTGYPFSVTANTVSAGIGGYNGQLYAKQIAPISNNHCGGGAHSVNGPTGTLGAAVPCSFVNDFVDPTDFGQGRRNSIYGSSYTNSDLSLAKHFAIPKWESANLVLRVTAFNVFNHPNFGQANGNVDSGAFGTISNDVSTPTSILGSFLGGNADPRLLQMNAKFTF